MIIGPATIPGADMDYTFGLVSMVEAFIDYGGNCGNIPFGVGPHAINMGLVTSVEQSAIPSGGDGFGTFKLHPVSKGGI